MAAGEQSGDLAEIWRQVGSERGTKNGREGMGIGPKPCPGKCTEEKEPLLNAVKIGRLAQPVA